MGKQIRIWFDGACHNKKNELTPMGVGLIIKKDEAVIEQLAYTPPVLGTSNVAEWIGCYLALKAAERLLKSPEVTYIEIFSDSQLIVNQINGQFEVRSTDLKVFYTQCVTIFKHINRKVSITHLRRQFNQEADRLSKQGLKDNPFSQNK